MDLEEFKQSDGTTVVTVLHKSFNDIHVDIKFRRKLSPIGYTSEFSVQA